MPYLTIQTNHTISDDAHTRLIKAASTLVATLLGKPENYVMVALMPPVPMLFAGTDDPTAYLEMKSIALPVEKTRDLSKNLCELIESHTSIDKSRIYIEFSDASRTMWGWNGATF